MPLKHNRIQAIIELGNNFRSLMNGTADSGLQQEFTSVVAQSNSLNPWFTPKSIDRAFREWSRILTAEKINQWADQYEIASDHTNLKVGVINAGNIPLVGLHDLLTVVLSGHDYVGKNASNDSTLLPFVARLLIKAEPKLVDRILFLPVLKEIDAVIATGSNNSARYFDYYFSKYPNIIRMNRNGIGVLNGNETKEELTALGEDIFTYYGLGCRNISKVYVPHDYIFNDLFESVFCFNEVMSMHKYMNNFEYNNSVLLLKQIPFLQNGFLIVREESSIPSPVSILHYEYYDGKEQLENELLGKKDQLQCIATSANKFESKELNAISLPFGKTQSPELSDYADGVDTLRFLTELKS